MMLSGPRIVVVPCRRHAINVAADGVSTLNPNDFRVPLARLSSVLSASRLACLALATLRVPSRSLGGFAACFGSRFCFLLLSLGEFCIEKTHALQRVRGPMGPFRHSGVSFA